jgi:hypothetical protein
VKLGELLVADGLLTSAQVEQALRAQVMWGGRLGTNLVELGLIDLDALSRALGRQHQLPAALARHFERADPRLQQGLSSEFAERYLCVPLMRVNDGKDVIVSVVSPLATKPHAIVADELAIEPEQIVQAVAAELRIRYHLERVYQIPRGVRFLRSRGPTVPASPQFEVAPEPPEPPSTPDLAIPEPASDDGMLTMPVSMPSVTVVSKPPSRADVDEVADADADAAGAVADPDGAIDIPMEIEPEADSTAPTRLPSPRALDKPPEDSLDDLTAHIVTDDDASAVPAAPIKDEPSGRDRRQYVRTLADMVDPAVPSGLDHKTLGRIAIRRVAVNAESGASSSFPEATRAIRRATDRERISELVMSAIDKYAPTCNAAMLLVVRGEAAIGWKGFVRNQAPPPEFAVPLDRPGLVVVAQKNTTARCSAGDLGQIDRLLLEALGHPGGDTGDLVIVPIAIAGQVVCLIATTTAPDAPVAAVEAVAAAAGAAFARLMSSAGRPAGK